MSSRITAGGIEDLVSIGEVERLGFVEITSKRTNINTERKFSFFIDCKSEPIKLLSRGTKETTVVVHLNNVLEENGLYLTHAILNYTRHGTSDKTQKDFAGVLYQEKDG